MCRVFYYYLKYCEDNSGHHARQGTHSHTCDMGLMGHGTQVARRPIVNRGRTLCYDFAATGVEDNRGRGAA